MRRLCTIVGLLAAISCTGCMRGWVYTNVTVPLVCNMDKTPRGSKMATIDSRQIKEPITRVRMSVEWNSHAIGDAAKRKGLKEVYFADMQTFSLFGGVWKQRKVRVWGE